MESYYEGCNVTNALQIDDDEMLVSIIENDTEMRVCKINLDTRNETMIIPPQDKVLVLDISLIPFSEDAASKNAFFLMHTGKGIFLVNAIKGKKYLLAQNEQSNFNVCKSIAVESLEADDPSQGFWLCQIDNGLEMQQMIKAFLFDA